MKRTQSCIPVRLALAVIVLTPAANAPAQESPAGPQVGRGSRVRITTHGQPGNPVVGMVVALTSDSIDINMEKGGFLSFRRADVNRVELSIGRTRKTTKGAVIGAAIGAGLGYLVLRDDDYFGPAYSDSEAVGVGMFGGAVWGALGGYRIQRDRWVAASMGAFDAGDRAAQIGPPVPAVSTSAYVPAAPLQGAPAGGGGASGGLYTGARVRVRHAGGLSEGNVIALDETTLTIASRHGVLPISKSAIVTVESWSGERRRTLRGALIGAVVVGLGDFTGKPECVGYVEDVDCTRAKSVAIGAGSGAVVGAVIGALLKQSRWEPVSFARNSSTSPEAPDSGLEWGVAPTFTRKGGGLRLQLSW